MKKINSPFRIVGRPGKQYLYSVVDEGRRPIWWKVLIADIRQALNI